MLRKRISRWTSKSDGGEQAFCAFPESFWHSYIELLGNDTSHGHKDITPPNLTKYHAHSAAVLQIKSFFASEQLQPSTSQIIVSLKSPFLQGDVVKAYHLIRYFQLSDVGFFITNDGFDRVGSPIQLQGAENWNHVMCYFDALLFSMFANLESFEPILFVLNQHPNALVTQLLCLLRLYVNLMRLGNLITTDITQKICECLAKLGFTDALSHRQQDCAPLFEFLTEILAMPLLTFRVEIQHSGKQDNDDRKYSKERILFVSIPEDDASDEPILLEECLEHYFNNSISVKRELQRRATIEEQKLSAQPMELAGSSMLELVSNTESESAEKSRSSTSLPFVNGHSNPVAAPSKSRVQVRTRSSTLSIWSVSSLESKPREVMLPAWMLLRLLPFYTDDNELNNANESVARNTHEFANRRPVLPICLKRYSFSSSDKSTNRSRRKIVIPPVIDLPLFVADDASDLKDNSLSFKLILESAVCHRGTVIQSGHFVSAVRKNAHVENESLENSLDASWFLYDDMSPTRVVTKTFREIFEREWPYLLFYRLVPSDSSGALDRFKLDSTSNFDPSPILAPKGHRSKFWAEETLSPILSLSEEGRSHTLNISELTIDSFINFPSASVPIPESFPGNPDFVDIRKRYLWYVTDKDKNYYKESASLSKTGSRNMSISVTPQYRRNSQWSDTSDISGLSLNGEPSLISNPKLPTDASKIKVDVHVTGPNEEVKPKKDINILPKPKTSFPDPTPQENKLEETNIKETIIKEKTTKQNKIKDNKIKEHKLHLHRIFSHEKNGPPSLPKSHVRKRHAEYKKEKCSIV
ncbi:cysteine proteinase [Metschnikowia bicuspidata var. bicuspidata NRRL YB-4993]|uniref:ubiquitinyl hydrolase 1 n=1 Tax=Metschnikowia bicuspidata var. bicuspidata NRRL YB-4993 TaxID=869754 RepID=A0A1A0H556_9ASCO|nr:cysteine proteinase [Metschnikowia bicuspidata var. bicuspidata NRRL YB-4993]OBA19085.1 cysteine proteinase [Metschnikowia bicuspidata var. bicuspidata NRRL YB-4993]